MSGIRFFLLGRVRVEGEDIPGQPELTRTLQGLLGYILLNRQRALRREVLAEIFWGDQPEERARSCLSTALWRLRRVLGQGREHEAACLLTAPTGEVSFNLSSDYWLDAAVFEAKSIVVIGHTPEEASEDSIRDLGAAVDLYTGDVMEGFFDDWALRERERLRLLYLNALAFLMRYHALHHAFDASLRYGQRILYHDPLREEVHRDLIRLYLETGQRPLAIRQYEACRETLQTELGVSPMVETQALYALAVSGSSLQTDLGGSARTGLSRVLDEARLARRGLQTASDLLDRTIHLLEDQSSRRM